MYESASGSSWSTTPAECLLVIGIHHEELGFGDRGAARVDPCQIAVLRIPRGICQNRCGTEDLFYFKTRHREIYLQLHQQIRRRHRLLIDLHGGLDDHGRSADLFCYDHALLARLVATIRSGPYVEKLRLIKIIHQTRSHSDTAPGISVSADALTWIPREIWGNSRPIYIGLEIYLPAKGTGEHEDRIFTTQIIDMIRGCTISQRETCHA